MQLFQNSVLKQHLATVHQEPITKAFDLYKKDFLPKIENIKNSKEEQYQYGFFQDLFVGILGYTLNPSPNFNLTTEQKNITNSKKADGAILKDGKVIAVIELKSTKTKVMDKIVNQAFNYKNNHPTCKYIITSNFEKLRFYIEHSDKFEEFNLFSLNEERFTLLYTLLNKEAIFDDTPLSLKQDSKLQEEKISNELYKKYAGLRIDLFENLVKNNPNIERLELLENTQKLLDRMIFIFFAEDRGILPTNTIQAIIDRYTDDIESRELYHFYKIYFNAINKGNDRLKISEYNGGLFATDHALDALVIDDEVMRSAPLSLSAYDFNSDVDVNILGHIFENSLNDIEEMKAKIDDESFDNKKSKRKKDGVFYTPEYITKYIVENTLGKLCEAQKEKLGLTNIEITVPKHLNKLNKSETKQRKALDAYREYLLQLKILDPACGSGAFLNQALNFLLAEHEFIDESIKTLEGGGLGLYDVRKGILENNLYGVDINAEAVEIAKLSLWLRTVEKGRKLNSLAQKIKVGNSLIDDKSVVDNAFVWEEEFPEVFEQGGFDVIIGNPPYVQLQSIKEVSKQLENQKYKSFEKTGDLYVLFYELGNELLRENGLLGYITSNKWLRAKYGKKLRGYLSKESNPKILMDLGSGIFESATVDSNIFITEKSIKEQCNLFALDLSKEKEFLGFESYDSKSVNISKCSDEIWTISSPLEQSIKIKVDEIGLPLKDLNINIYRGIQTGNNDVFIIDKAKRKLLIEQDNKSIELIKPILQGRDIQRYGYQFKEQYLIYVTDETNIEQYQAIYNYLLSHKSILEQKKEVRENKMLWYVLYRPAKKHISEFAKNKIFYTQIGHTIDFYLDKDEYYSNDKLYFITSADLNLSYLLSILNSTVMRYYYSLIFNFGGGKGKDTFLNISIPNLDNKKQAKFIINSKNMIDLNKNFKETKQNFLDELELEKIPKKLQNFETLDFDAFIKEYKKTKKLKFTDKLAERNFKNEWKALFENDKRVVTELQIQIDATDREIDLMVYELYGLSDDEIALVEGK